MNKKEYDSIVEQLNNALDTNPEKVTQELLDQMKKFKPVTLNLECVEAKKAWLETGDYNAFFQRMAGKGQIDFANPEMRLYREMYHTVYSNIQWSYDEYRIKNNERYLQGDFIWYGLLQDYCKQVLNKTPESEFKTAEWLYVTEDFISYVIHKQFLQKQQLSCPFMVDEWVYQLSNMGELLEQLSGQSSAPFVLMESENNEPLMQVLCRDLCSLGKTVYYITKPLVCEGEGIQIRDTVAISMENAEEKEGAIVFTPVELVFTDGTKVDNREYLLEAVNNEYNQNKLLYLLAEGYLTDELSLRKASRQRMARLSGRRTCDNRIALSWYGDYLCYISGLYQTDCRKLVEQTPEKKFSIVIPARNSAYTLRYALQTCLEQEYEGDYEIIVSDNSIDGNTAVYELCRELNHPKLVYLRTPRNLHLPKSFEYAYLHAKGEYIFALGSDDGLLPWALEVLDKVTQQYPQEEILQWERGFYAWPGFNGGQQNQFIVPGGYTQGSVSMYYKKSSEYLAEVIADKGKMYKLPMLYINSCFKRSYLETLLKKTGQLWSGVCQDIYMGITTVAIKSQILNIKYPLSIAGMSTGSVGAVSNAGTKTEEELQKQLRTYSLDGNVGGYCRSYLEELLPPLYSDTGSLYDCMLRLINMGVMPEEYLYRIIPFQKIFEILAKEISREDVAYVRKLYEIQHAAELHGQEFLEWCTKTILEPGLEPMLMKSSENVEKTAKTYKNTKYKDGTIMLDASEVGVQNIHEAVGLFCTLFMEQGGTI